jgi:DNA invertase Pin-like site-specific DNA recombinase
MKRVAIYLRVSTSKQDTDNQRRELGGGRRALKLARRQELPASAAPRAGISALGSTMLKAVNAKEFDMIAAWSVDRLGRSLTDLLGILQGLHD